MATSRTDTLMAVQLNFNSASLYTIVKLAIAIVGLNLDISPTTALWFYFTIMCVLVTFPLLRSYAKEIHKYANDTDFKMKYPFSLTTMEYLTSIGLVLGVISFFDN